MSEYREIIVKEYHNEKGLITRREIGEELVRCKDCKYKVVTKEGEYNPEDIVCDYWQSDGLTENDFCSQGKEQEHES